MPPDPVRRLLLDYLQCYCVGVERARSKRQLLGVCGCLVAVRDVERMVQEAVLAGAPIGSSDKGYFWCLSREDFGRARAYLVCRMWPQRLRIEALGRAMRQRFPDATLFEEARA